MNKIVGMGDDLNILHKTIENAQFGIRPVLSIMVISPLFGAKHNRYWVGLDRLIFIRKKFQILHKHIEFLLVDLVSSQFIFIKSGVITKIPIKKHLCAPILYKIYQNMLLFIDKNKHQIYISEFYTRYESVMSNQNINMYAIENDTSKELSSAFQYYLKQLEEQNIFSPYNVEREHYGKNNNTIIFASDTEHTENRIFVEWPTPNPKKIKSFDTESLKLSFKKPTKQYEFLPKLLDHYNWNYIPYDHSLGLVKTFDLVGSSKYIIGPEGGICHLARMFGVPFVMIIPTAIENLSIVNDNTITCLFYHWAKSHQTQASDSQEIVFKKSIYFMFEKDLTRKKQPQLIESIEKFFESPQDRCIVFFTVDVDDPRTCAFVKNFCKAYDLKYGTDVEIYKPDNS